jgi:type III secretion protein V
MTGAGGFMIMRGRGRRAAASASATMPSLSAAAAPALQMPVFPEKGAKERDEDIEVVEPVTFALTVPLIVDISSSVRNYIQPKRLMPKWPRCGGPFTSTWACRSPACTCA